MQTPIPTGHQRQVARVESVLLKGGTRQEGNPVCWAEVEKVLNGTYYVNPIQFETDGTLSLNAAFDRFEVMPVDQAPAEIRSFLNRRYGNRR